MSAPAVRPVHIAPNRALFREAPDGTLRVRSTLPLGPYPRSITEPLEHWARHAPERTFLARRGPDGEWRRIGYAETLARVRSLAQALLDRRLSARRPVVIVSGNGIEHALLALAALHAGIPHAPLSPAYSLVAKTPTTLRHLLRVVDPGLVFAAEGAAFEPALRATLPRGVELVVHDSAPAHLPSTPLADLLRTTPTAAVDDANARVGPDTIAKVLFTSGSTGMPKGVINTQRMLCANQEQLRTMMAFMTDEPPVLCDWLPWNHTFGGNHNLGLALYNGGTLYIDDGRPMPGAFEPTVRNLREIATTAYFNVPRGYEMLLPRLRADAALRRTFFSRVKMLFYAAAGLGQRFWDELRALSVESCGEEILMMTGLGATETAPYALSTGPEGAASGVVGLPVPGVELKLAPVGDKLEARVRGPNVTPGFWRDPERTRAAFDEEGFYRLGDAVRFVDQSDPQRGFLFDGRLDEDFKLSTGTWVSVGPLRSRLLAHFAPYVHDVVFAGHDREFVAALLFPNLAACRSLAPGLAPDAAAADLLSAAAVRALFQERLDAFAGEHRTSSTSVRRALLLDAPPTLDSGELTEKGSINQKTVLRNRAALVDELYAPGSAAVLASAEASPRSLVQQGGIR